MMDPQRLAAWRRAHPPIQGADLSTDRSNTPPPREGLVRAVMPGVELRSETREDGTESNTLFGHFARFNSWTEINSFIEGNFIERVAPGALRKTLKEGRPKILLNHGMDPMLGDRVIATLNRAEEDDDGGYYEARLFDGLDPVLLAGLRAGEYGASFRFNVVRDEWDDNPERSESNPKGLRERTLKEVRVSEFGPVTFPAYADATAGVRSMTDEIVLGRAIEDPDKLERCLAYFRDRDARRTPLGIVVPATPTTGMTNSASMTNSATNAAITTGAVATTTTTGSVPFRTEGSWTGRTYTWRALPDTIDLTFRRDFAATASDGTLAAMVREAAGSKKDGPDLLPTEDRDDDVASATDAATDTGAEVGAAPNPPAGNGGQEPDPQESAQQGDAAPSKDRAGQQAHPDQERRGRKANRGRRLFGLSTEEKTTWRL
jgi:HK97 family phage prohead protease